MSDPAVAPGRVARFGRALRPRGVVRALRRLDGALSGAAAAMTPGQRWTAVLALLFGACVVLFGPPPLLRTAASGAVPGSPPAAGGAGAAAVAGPAATGGAGTQLTGAAQPVAFPAGAGASAVAGATPGAAGPSGSAPGGLAPEAGAGAMPVAVLVSGDPSGLPGRSDAAMAAAFLAGQPFPWTAVDLDAAPTPAAACAAARGAGPVAVASHDLPPAVLSCLGGSGMTVLAFDQGGTRLLSGGGAVVSTRRAAGAALVDLGRWGVHTGTLSGRVGVVADSSLRAGLAPALAGLRRAGVRVVATDWVAPGGPTSLAGYQSAVSAFEGAGVEDVVLAAPVAVQDGWQREAAAVGATFHYLVSDADDAVVDESYVPTFDGALAYTSLRVPWYSRSHGSTPGQSRCDAAWAAANGSGVTLPSEEPAVYAWCEEAGLLRAAYQALSTGPAPAGGRYPAPAVAAALRKLRVSSPLTADLGPLGDGGWGPEQDAVLRWRAACLCWEPVGGFSPRW